MANRRRSTGPAQGTTVLPPPAPQGTTVPPAVAPVAPTAHAAKKEYEPQHLLWFALVATLVFCVGSWLTRGGLAAWGINPTNGNSQQPAVVINNCGGCGAPAHHHHHAEAPAQVSENNGTDHRGVAYGDDVWAPANTDVIATDGQHQLTIVHGTPGSFRCSNGFQPTLEFHTPSGRCLGIIQGHWFSPGEGWRQHHLAS